MAKSRAEASRGSFDALNTPDYSLVQTQTAQKHKKVTRKGIFDDDGTQMEHGDLENAVHDEDFNDYSVHQFLVRDDAREGSASSDDGAQGRATVMAKSRAEESRGSFDALNTPDYSFVQTQTAQKHKKASSKGIFDDDGTQMEHGDLENAVHDEDFNDYSVHQFLVRDDAREGSASSDDGAQGRATQMAKARAEEGRGSFDALNTPDYSLVQTQKAQKHKKALSKGIFDD